MTETERWRLMSVAELRRRLRAPAKEFQVAGTRWPPSPRVVVALRFGKTACTLEIPRAAFIRSIRGLGLDVALEVFTYDDGRTMVCADVAGGLLS